MTMFFSAGGSGMDSSSRKTKNSRGRAGMRPLVGWLIAGAMASNAGCAGQRRARSASPAGSSPSTLGHDLRTLPRGRMIGPPGLGVDLARDEETGPNDGP